MSMAMIENRLANYAAKSKIEEDNALKEIQQEIALFALSRTDFFKKASFMGGTALRIVHGLPRFSEDLDFSSIETNPEFKWEPFLQEIVLEFKAYGLEVEIKDRSDVPIPIKRAFLKDESFGKLIALRYERRKTDTTITTIRLEIDTNPPQFATREPKLVSFPIPHSVVCFDIPTLFAGKLNALLTRRFVKGRDWFDFAWYAAQRPKVNEAYLASALRQFSYPIPKTGLSRPWLKEQLSLKIGAIDWQKAKDDVSFLLRDADRFTLDNWNTDFFLHFLGQM